MRAIDGTGNDAIRRSYERNASYWTKIVREELDPFQKEITDPALLTAIGDPKGLDFVDAGCGEGFFARLLVERGARHVYGVDISDALVAAAKTHPAADIKTSSFFQCDVASLPLPDDSVDIVYANRLPHALTDPGRRFTEFARVLRPGGRLIYLSLHPCFYVSREERAAASAQSPAGITAAEYFAGRTIVQNFNVGGLISPGPSIQRFYSLETHCQMITNAGFVISNITEPRAPQTGDHTKDSRSAMPLTPLFLLLSCKYSPSG